MKKTSRIVLVILLLILLTGIGVAVDLSYIHFKVTTSGDEYQSFCNINETLNCDAVSVSPWATLFGIPIAVLGTLTYLFCALLVGLRLSRFREKLPHAGVYLAWMGTFSLMYSLYLAWICYAEIGTWCIMCMALYIVNFFFFLFSWLACDLSPTGHVSALISDVKWIFGGWKRLLAAVVVLAAIVSMFTIGAVREHQAKMKALEEVMQKLEKISKPVSLEGRIIGNPNGKVVIVVFSDYQCPFCLKMDLMLEELVKKYQQLKVIRKDFPLDQACNPMVPRPFHSHACQASMFAICADQQGKGLEYHNFLLHNQSKIGTEFFPWSVAEVGLDEKRMQDCLNGSVARKTLQQDLKEAIDLEIPGTPTLLIGRDELVKGALTKSELEKIIQLKSEL